jgi:hypothetical protein
MAGRVLMEKREEERRGKEKGRGERENIKVPLVLV